MFMINVSAPGKLMLFGEHAVVYGKPCIVTAVDHRMSVSINYNEDDIIILNAPEVNIKDLKVNLKDLKKEHPKGAKFVLKAVDNFFDKYNVNKGLKINTKSEFSSLFGFGSSSAVTVSTIKALSILFNIAMTKKEIFDLSYKTVLDIQGSGSGFDVAAATWGGTLYYVKGGKIMEELEIDNIPLIVGYTGIKADTVTLMNSVKKQMEDEPERISKIYNDMEKIADESKKYFYKKDWKMIGKFMNDNQNLLRQIKVSTPELERLIGASIKAGAYGAKLSGAGGGDCMIALGINDNINKIEKSIESMGGKIIQVNSNAEGVRCD